MGVATYDITRSTVTMDGEIITGFHDSVLTVAYTEDIVSLYVGAMGDAVYSENANRSATVTLTLEDTSISLPFIRDLAASRTAFSLNISDVNPDSELHINAENCRIQKIPDSNRAKQVGSVSIAILVPQLDLR